MLFHELEPVFQDPKEVSKCHTRQAFVGTCGLSWLLAEQMHIQKFNSSIFLQTWLVRVCLAVSAPSCCTSRVTIHAAVQCLTRQFLITVRDKATVRGTVAFRFLVVASRVDGVLLWCRQPHAQHHHLAAARLALLAGKCLMHSAVVSLACSIAAWLTVWSWSLSCAAGRLTSGDARPLRSLLLLPHLQRQRRRFGTNDFPSVLAVGAVCRASCLACSLMCRPCVCVHVQMIPLLMEQRAVYYMQVSPNQPDLRPTPLEFPDCACVLMRAQVASGYFNGAAFYIAFLAVAIPQVC